ncbi:MAG: DUF4249 family protein, partial [Bacteroidales bacterium]|nr:DUF4249 family protein [Bacteroidales bacterium]
MKKIIILVAVLVAVSCEKVVEFDIKDSDRYVVVNALPCVDSTFFANITYSRFFLDNQAFLPVTDATVTVDVNGVTYSSTGRDGANYLFPFRAASGDTMTLHVSVPGRDPIVGGTRVPALPAMLPPLAEIDTLLPFNTSDITFTLSDP